MLSSEGLPNDPNPNPNFPIEQICAFIPFIWLENPQKIWSPNLGLPVYVHISKYLSWYLIYFAVSRKCKSAGIDMKRFEAWRST